jgi:hypothetical protein
MKARFLFLLFLVLSGIVSAQDTIFVKNGKPITAIIVEKNNVEIKYKKFGIPESTAIYSVFISDITSIHYKDGIVADYTLPGQKESDNRPKTALEMAGSMRSIKISFGLSGASFNRNESDRLQLFWKYYDGINGPAIGGNKIYFPISLKMNFNLGQSGRNWMGDELQLAFTPDDAIYASNTSGTNEIKLKSFYYNIILYYGHTLNHKKNLAGIIEPGLDLAFMSGLIKLNNTNYDISGNFGAGFHLALGADWVITKRLLACARVGERFMTIKESHKNNSSSTGYSTFYVNPSVNNDLLNVKWSGPYASLGLCWSFYVKLKLPNAQ